MTDEEERLLDSILSPRHGNNYTLDDRPGDDDFDEENLNTWLGRHEKRKVSKVRQP